MRHPASKVYSSKSVFVLDYGFALNGLVHVHIFTCVTQAKTLSSYIFGNNIRNTKAETVFQTTCVTAFFFNQIWLTKNYNDGDDYDDNDIGNDNSDDNDNDDN